MSTALLDNGEHDKVYGETFALYSAQDMRDFIEPLRIRFERNKLSPKLIFEGKRCFDAGCGNGRGSLFMLAHGAEHVVAYDVSATNVSSTQQFAQIFDFSNIEVQQGSLDRIAFPKDSFDVIWCNGVIMHTQRPNDCLEELSRILKSPGNMWLYVYGAGGMYWQIIRNIRVMLRNVSTEECMRALRLFRYETRYIAEFIDDWYTTYLRAYTHVDMARRLEELGFETPQPLKYGTDYDTSHRITTFQSNDERLLMGEGDLRYLLKKVSSRRERNFPIGEGEFGSSYQNDRSITESVDPLFREMMEITADKNWLRVAAAAYIQRDLRILLTKNEPLSMASAEAILRDAMGQVRRLENL